jgi:ketosteroid isomerase-like protein
MTAKTPAQLHEAFVQHFNNADLDSLISLYEPTATLLPFPGEPVSGHAAIRDSLGQFLALKGHMDLKIDRIVLAQDIALLFSSWTLNGTGPDGTAVAMAGQTSDVARRQADGSWLFVIDNPQGANASKR